MKKIFLVTAAILFVGLFGKLESKAQQQENLKIIAKFDSINRAMPREKLYVHLDKNVYSNLDTVWFKAYLFDVSLKSASIQSGLIYVEIIDQKGNAIKTQALPTGGGLTWGGIALNSRLYNAGVYTFRAYTNWMQNFGNRYLFQKKFRIVSLSGETTSTTTAAVTNTYNSDYKSNSSSPSKFNDIDLQFLPEGGAWIADRPQVLAFKALKADGKGIAIQGEILDSKQNKIISFKSNAMGMGFVTITPRLGESYTAVIASPNVQKRVNLPKVLAQGVNLHVDNKYNSDSITVKVNSNLVDQELILVGQSRGLISFATKIKPNIGSKKLTISKNIFPSGISQVTIFNAAYQAINERSFFINHGDQLQISTQTTAQSFKTRDSIPIELRVTNAGGIPIVGSFSMAVTDDSQVSKDSLNNDNILSYLLLSSDLKGEIESPASYFNQFNEQKHNDLEALVLTQGWSSYFVQPKKTSAFKVEKDFTISGLITNLVNKPSAKANVSLIGKNRNKVMALQTVANEKGEFVFDKLPAMDSASLIIQGLNSKDRKGTLGVTLNEFKRPSITITPTISTAAQTLITDSVSKNLVKVQREAYYKVTGVMLNEVNIKGKRTVKNSKNLNGPGGADQIFTDEDLDKISKKTLYDILAEKVDGFHAKVPRKRTNREFFIKNNRLKLVIDGMDVDYFYTAGEGRDDHYSFIRQYLEGYSAEDLLGIEVMTSLNNTTNYDTDFTPDVFVYQSKGDFLSYIEVTTKTGSGPFLRKSANIYLYKPFTYGDFKVFYSPKYKATNKTSTNPDFRSTLYWVPNLITNTEGLVKTSFFSSDKKGSYTVWIEGSDMKGHIGMRQMKVEIK